ncbi:ankyrin repeat-containing domain protein [Trichoderma pleuroticola]
MKRYARRRTGTTRIRARSTNINSSTFRHHIRILQGNINIFRDWGNRAFSPSDKPSAAVQAQLEEKEKTDCRQSLSFRDLDARLQNISPVQPGTCEWFFETSQFLDWYDGTKHGHEFLWIKGNPGTGKSTLVKRIFEYCQTKQDYVIAAYFFNARGAELEKTPLGMLRSLLFHLLQHEPSLYDHFLPMFRKKQLDYDVDWEWCEPELTSFFLSKLQKCQSRPLLLIVDALDECIERDVQKVAEFLQRLSTNAIDAGNTLKICLSSRHYPFVRFEEYQELVLETEKQHDEDIVKYISSKLTRKDKEIEEELRKKSSGIFMWVVLVITMLNSAYEDGKIEVMKPMLDKIPAKLEQVFAVLLDNNNPDKDETILILQCVLFAKRPLTPEEIYFAIVAGTNSQALGRWDPLQITPDIIRRRIISSSRGLVEICKTKDEIKQDIPRSDVRRQRIKLKRQASGFVETRRAKPEARKGRKETVQFIHGSVNDFLLRNGRLQSLDPGLIPDPVAKSHERLKDCCLSYLMMESLEPQNVGGMKSDFPFLEYASRYLFDHAEEATSVGQAELLHDDVFKRVEQFHSYFVDYGQDGAPLNLLQTLAARNLPKCVGILVDRGADINAKGIPCGTALEAAIKFESEETVKTLLSKGAKIDPRGKRHGHTTLYKAFEKGNRGILAMLIDRGATLGIMERIGHGPVLHHAAETGDKDIIAMVLDKGANVNALGLVGNALCTAASGGHKDIVEMLLEKEANIHTRGLIGSPLTCAALRGHMEVVKLLLKKGVNIYTRGLIGSPLAYAAFGGHMEVVKLLLKKGANIYTRGLIGSPLACAAYEGRMEVVKLLLEKGANTNTGSRLLGSALYAAVVSGNREIVEMLLKNGANVNARGLVGLVYLGLKSLFKGMEIPKILLEEGFNMKPWENFYGTALQAAVATREGEEMIQLPLDNGAKI